MTQRYFDQKKSVADGRAAFVGRLPRLPTELLELVVGIGASLLPKRNKLSVIEDVALAGVFVRIGVRPGVLTGVLRNGVGVLKRQKIQPMMNEKKIQPR